MAKTKEIFFLLERKFSDKDYGSLGYSSSETIIIEEGDNRQEEYVKLKSRVSKRASVLDKELQDMITRMNVTQKRNRKDD